MFLPEKDMGMSGPYGGPGFVEVCEVATFKTKCIWSWVGGFSYASGGVNDGSNGGVCMLVASREGPCWQQ